MVAEESPPALLTVALPGLLAGPVEAARVANALVAVAALESHSAPVVVQLGTPVSTRFALPLINECPGEQTGNHSLALPGFLAEAVLFVAARQADGWKRQKKTHFLDTLMQELEHCFAL